MKGCKSQSSKGIPQMPDPQSKLLVGSLDFIVSAAEFASSDETRNWKYATLHLWTGMELLLKARLAREHWSLLFSNVDRADHSKLSDGNFKSVDSDQAVIRLKQVCGVEIDPHDWRFLKGLRNLSNLTKHYFVEASPLQLKSILSRCMNIAITFCETQRMSDESKEIQDRLYLINRLMQEFDEFVDERLEWLASHHKLESHMECMRCWQETCTMDDSGVTCHFCGTVIDSETLSEWWADMVDDVAAGDLDLRRELLMDLTPTEGCM